MTRTELGLLYEAKADVERAHYEIDGPARDYLSRCLFTMKRLIDGAIIEHEREDRHHSSEAATQPGGPRVEQNR